ncbi:helix-turn-helix transcriptional regulator [Chamaesiphon sp. VAR_48_metabat_135_sub]|uniref:helix-turn-helix domain-containing protein n=1 Tax=Chamaesiphon sp. VAR_48_metabat_135_sub TaxID=2964699 RepID=UPI00286CCA9A|nr:helix-turn-helix transcriptional regulator [Chamaesiphon sp. VAR_48_metabat_135_sub]
MAIIEITPNFPGSTTTDRLLETIENYPNGLTIKELANILNRPISMIQICLKILIASRKVAIRRQSDGAQLAPVYISKSERIQSQHPFQLATRNSSGNVTPMQLREVAGLTKIQLAAELGLSVRTINDWEQKRSQPKLVPSQLKQMMSVYQCTLDRLIEAFE